MPVSKKPRKKYSSKKVDASQQMQMPEYALCLARASIGGASDDDFNQVSGLVNLGIVIASNKGDLPNTVALMAHGAQFLNACNRDLNSINEAQMSGLGAAANMAYELINHVPAEELKKAIETIKQLSETEVEDVVFQEIV